MNSNFIFCEAFDEYTPLLKEEIKCYYPELKFSFSHKNFLTYKSEKPISIDFKMDLIFAKNYGLTLTKGTRDQLEEYINQIGFNANQFQIYLFETTPELFWLGINTKAHTSFPRSYPNITLPEAAPSKAYLKMEEMLLLTMFPIKEGESVLELGCAPGGMSYSLVQRKINVYGVDSADISPNLKSPLFTYKKCSFQHLEISELPKNFSWIVIDLNLDPFFVFKHIRPIILNNETKVKGIFINIKLVETKIITQKVKLQNAFKEMGFKVTIMKHLHSNQKEFFIFASKQ